MIQKSKIEEIKSLVDTPEFYEMEGGVVLKKAGKIWQGLCPFHREKTPSFTVFEDGEWHCFGCGEGGDVVTFSMKRNNASFPETMRKLGKMVGVELAPETPADKRKRLLMAIVAKAAGAFHDSLLYGRTPVVMKAKKYLKEKGFTIDTVKRFQLGVSPLGGKLLEYLLKAGFKMEDIKDAGLATDKGKDFFNGRLMFPIRNQFGAPVGFGARSLNGGPKYINSPESRIFQKGDLLYALDQSISGIRHSGEAVIVEGYTDALLAHQLGHTNVVAQMGTALTTRQRQQLRRYAQSVCLVYDGDEAGRKAALKLATEDNGFLSFSVGEMPAGIDPYDFLESTPQYWDGVIEGKTPLPQYFIDNILMEMGETAEEKSNAVKDIGECLVHLDPIQRDHYVRELALRIGVRESSVTTVVLSTARPQPPKKLQAPEKSSITMDIEDYYVSIAIYFGFPINYDALNHPENKALSHAYSNGQSLDKYADRLEYLFSLPEMYSALSLDEAELEFAELEGKIISSNWQKLEARRVLAV